MKQVDYNARCRVCQSDQRTFVESLLSRGLSAAIVAQKVNFTFGDDKSRRINPASIHRHRNSHMSEARIRALGDKSIGRVLDEDITLDQLKKAEGDHILATIVAYRGAYEQDIRVARESGDLRAVASLAGRRDKLVEITLRYLGELGIRNITNNNTVALTLSPDFLKVRRVIQECLRPFPAARRAVAAGLAALGKADDVEVVDVTSTEIAGEPALVISDGTEQAVAPPATGSYHDDSVGSVTVAPTTIHLETAIDSRTGER